MIVLPDFVAPDQAICEGKYGMLQKRSALWAITESTNENHRVVTVSNLVGLSLTLAVRLQRGDPCCKNVLSHRGTRFL